jgi:hypothetical protein
MTIFDLLIDIYQHWEMFAEPFLENPGNEGGGVQLNISQLIEYLFKKISEFITSN